MCFKIKTKDILDSPLLVPTLVTESRPRNGQTGRSFGTETRGGQSLGSDVTSTVSVRTAGRALHLGTPASEHAGYLC
jgi:hypothetical protein